MQRLHKIVATLSLAFAIIVAGSATSFAKPSAARGRTLNGIVIKVDRAARTLLVREISTQQVYTVQVPEGRTVRTKHQSAARASIEQIMLGMIIDTQVN